MRGGRIPQREARALTRRGAWQATVGACKDLRVGRGDGIHGSW